MNYKFQTTDSRLKKYNGQECEIVKTYNEPDEHHDAEVLPMHDVRMGNGEVIHVFDDELVNP